VTLVRVLHRERDRAKKAAGDETRILRRFFGRRTQREFTGDRR
jgi:hypothetical protein